MNRFSSYLIATAAIVAIVAYEPAQAGEQEAIDGCIDRLRAVGTPDAQGGGEVISSEFSEAATLVMLRDAGGTVWRCLAYSDGTVGELVVSQAADDGGGAMAGNEGTTATERVQFAKGTSGAVMTTTLTPGSSVRYLLGAKNGQDLKVRVDAEGPDIYYQIFNPDGTFLLDQITAAQEYGGQLWQSGDHVIEVINRGNSNTSYSVTFSIN